MHINSSFLKLLKHLFIGFILYFCLNLSIFAQVDTSFWFVVPEVTVDHGDRPISFEIISHDEPITYTITQPANPGFIPITGSIPANSTVSRDVTAFIDIFENKPANTILNYGLHISTSGPATVIYNIRNGPNPDIFVLKGRHALGKRFFTLFQASAYNAPVTPTPAYSSIDIIATEDNTTITITPTKAIVGHAANIPFTIVLNRGETYSARAMGVQIVDRLSGTLIVADKPIAVTLKDDSIKGLYGNCADLVGDQIIPVQNIDNEYIVIKGFLSGNDKAYVMAIENNTDIHINGNSTPITTLNTGQTYTLDISQFSTYINSGKPFYLMHLTGQGCEYGCPVLPSLTGCCDSKTRISYLESGNIYTLIVTRSGNEGNFLFNNNAGIIQASMFSVVPGTNNKWMAAKVNLSASIALGASATISNTSGTFILGLLIANGQGCRYGYLTNYSNLHLGPDVTKCANIPYIIDPGPSWNSSLYSTGDTIAPLNAYDSGAYWVKATNYECSLTDTIIIHNLPDNSFKLGNDTSYCNNDPFPLTVNSVFISYLWNTGTTGNSIVATQTGEYWVKTIDANNCTYTDTINLHINKFKLLSNSDTICYGDTLQLFTSTANSWNWLPVLNISNPNSQNPFVFPKISTTYYITSSYDGSTSASPALTCSDSLNILVVHHLTDTIQDTTVCLQNQLNLSGTTGYLHYLWNNGQTTQSINIQSSGLYWVKVSDSLGCSATDSANILLIPTLNLTTQPAFASICKGDSTTITVSSVYPNAQFIWNTGETSPTITVKPLSTTSYTVTGTYAGCESSVSQTIIVKALPITSIIASNDTLCFNDSIFLQGNGALSYYWAPQNISSPGVWIKPSSLTTYNVTGTAINGCKSDTSISITVIPLPIISSAANPQSVCPGEPITLSATGGNSYFWSPYNINSQQITLSNPGTGSATVTGFGTFGCHAQSTVSFNTKPLPVLSISTSNDSICLNGSTALTANSTITGTQYHWSSNEITALINVSPALNSWYTVTGTVNNCSSKDSVLITVMPLPIVIATGTTDTICPGAPVTLNATGAISYSWQPFNLNTQQININPTISVNCIVTGYSNFGCSATDNFNITVSPKPALNLSFSDDTICVGTNVSLNISSSLPGTSFLWNTNSTSQIINVSPSVTTQYSCIGTYQGCTSSITKTIVVNPLPIVQIQATNDSICKGSSMILTGTGASTYRWGTPIFNGTQYTVTPSSSKTYYVTGTDVNGCKGTSSFLLTVVPLPVVNATATPSIICVGQNIVLSATGAISYSWTPFNLNGQSVTVAPIVSGDAYLTGTGTFGCQAKDTVSYTVKPVPSIGITATQDSICKNSSAILTANSSLAGTQYNWSTTQTGNTITVSPLVNTKYTVTGTLNGCFSKDSLLIIVMPLPTLNANATPNIICPGQTVNLSANGATTYNWAPFNQTTPTITVTPSSTITVTVTGSTNFGCQLSLNLPITVKPKPDISLIVTKDTICAGETTSISVTSSINGTGYIWTGGLTNNPLTVQPNTSNTYVCTGTYNGCSDVDSIRIIVNPTPNVQIFSPNDSLCIGDSLLLSGNGALTYIWSSPSYNGNQYTIAPIINTTYYITGTDNNNCKSSDTIFITVIPLPNVVINYSSNTICSGDSIWLTGTGATNYNLKQTGSFFSQILV